MHKETWLFFLAILIISCGGDGEVPLIDIAYPEDGAFVSGTVLIVVYATSEHDIHSVQFYIDDTLRSCSYVEPYTYAWVTSNLENNSVHTIYVAALDAAGNTGASDTISVIIVSDYFPLTVGNDWTYDMTVIYTTPYTSDTMMATYALEIGNATTLYNGTAVFPMIITMTPDDTLAWPYVDTIYLEETDDYIMAYDTKAATIPSDTVLAFPLELGKTWDNYEIIDQVDVTVPAGDFSDCWEIREAIDDDTTYTYWKSGVGMVKIDIIGIYNDDTWTQVMELVDYTVE